MATEQVDLDAISVLAEIVVRGGNVRDPRARETLQRAYRQHLNFPDVSGLSVVFRQGASLDELVKAASLPYPKVSYATVSRLRLALSAAGYEVILYRTPSRRLADHHTLAVASSGQPLTSLPVSAASALIRALIVVDNPYRQP